jgi:stage II sporulation protein AA (anti-sigma F factor antagonist)
LRSIEVTPCSRSAACVCVTGEIDVSTAQELLNGIVEKGRSAGAVELDMSRVSFMDAAGLHAIERACEEAEEHGFSLNVTAASPAANRVFDLTGSRALLDCR